MRTEVMPEGATAAAWLEYDPPGRSTEQVTLASCPFTIGRNDTADLQIDSNQVSREHAVISKHGRKYKVRDLGSTNGTFLNGQRVEEGTLSDGDLLVIADVEFTFFCGASGARRQTATQVMPPGEHDAARDTVWETIHSVRRTHEVVTHRCLRTLYQPVIQLPSADVFGYEAFASAGAGGAPSPRCEPLAPPAECRASARLRQLFRRLAVEESVSLPHGGRLLLAITAAESTEPSLISHLCQLRNFVGNSRQIVVEIPDSAVRSTADFRALLACLRDVQIQVAYDGYASGKARINEHKDVTPDYLKLAPSMFKSIHTGADRQRQVQLIVRASHDNNCEVIATGIDTEADLEVCRNLGCTLVQGDLLGSPQSVAALIQASQCRPACAKRSDRSTMQHPPKTREPIPGYVVKERIGVGGYGEVWSAQAPGGLTKAIKFVYGYFDDARAARELKALDRIKQVRHPFLLSLERFEIVDGQLVIVTELADQSLKDRFERVKQSGADGIARDELLGYLRDAADALDYMSENFSLQHLDVKPENLLLVGGRVKVADFGLVKDLHDVTASMMGGLTPIYAAPEVFDDRPSPRSDQYSLAIVYQEMLTGILPFPGRTPAQLASQHLHASPKLAGLPPSDQAVIARALAKDPALRFGNCRALVDALFVAGREGSAEWPDTRTGTFSTSDTTSNKSQAGRTDTDSRRIKGPVAKTQVLGSESTRLSGSQPPPTPQPVAAAQVVAELGPLELDAAEMRLRPTLYLGIGGTAGRVLRGVRRRLRDRFGEANVPVLKMLLLDTDGKNLYRMTQGDCHSALADDETMPLSLRNAHDYTNDSRNILGWLSRRWLYNIPRSLQTEGRRPLGRLALVDHGPEVVERLRGVLAELIDPESLTAAEALGVPASDEAPRVFLIASTSGGTGGGMVLDVAYAVRQLLDELGAEEAQLCGILTHSTDRNPSDAELAIANTYACLGELADYARAGYTPGQTTCGLPAEPIEGGAFAETYFSPLGHELNDEEFERGVESLASYVYLSSATQAAAALDACRAQTPPDEDGLSLRSFAAVSLGSLQTNLPTLASDWLCHGIVDHWRGVERQKRDHTSRPALFELSTDGAKPENDGPPATRHAESIGLSAAGLREQIGALLDSELGGDAEAVFARLRAMVEGQRQPIAAARTAMLLEAIRGQFDPPATPEAVQRSSQPALQAALERELRHFATPKGQAIRDFIVGLVDDPQQRVGAAVEAKDWYSARLREIDADAAQLLKSAQHNLQALEQTVLTTEQAGTRVRIFGARQAEKKRTADIDGVLLLIVRLKMQQFVLQGIVKLVKLLAASVSAAGDQIKDVQRELGQWSAQFDADSPWDEDDEERRPPADDLAARVEIAVADQLHDRLAQLARSVEQRVQTQFLEPRGGLRSVCLRADAEREAVLAALRSEARREILTALRGIAIDRAVLGADDASPEQSPERVQQCLEAARPRLTDCGGAQRLLAVVPACSAGGALEKAVRQATDSGATIIVDTDADFVLCYEQQQLSLPHVAAQVIDGRGDLAQIAARLHTRTDIAWSELPKLSEPVAEPLAL